MTPTEAIKILEDMYSMELAEPEVMRVLKEAIKGDADTREDSVQHVSAVGSSTSPTSLPMDKKLLDQAIKYFRSPVHEGETWTNLQFLQDLWAGDDRDDEGKNTFKYVQRLLIASEHLINHACETPITAAQHKPPVSDDVVDAAMGLAMGEDWNNGTHAKIYRPKLLKALSALKKGGGV